MAQYAARKVAICAGSLRFYSNIYIVSRGTHASLLSRAPSNLPVQVSVQTLVDLEKVYIRPRPHPRSVCVTCLGVGAVMTPCRPTITTVGARLQIG